MTTEKSPTKYINLLTDYGFKKIFGTESNKEFLIIFLNYFLPKHHQIKEIVIKKNEQLGSGELDRTAIYDIFCTAENGEEFIVEIQRKSQRYFKDRSVYYSTFPIQNAAIKGEDWDFQLPFVYTICLMDFVFKEGGANKEFIHHVQLKDQNGKLFYEKLNYIYVELKKFDKKVQELETTFKKFLFLIKNIHTLIEIPPNFNEPIFKKIFKMAELAKYTQEERAKYFKSLNGYRDLNNVIKYAQEEAKEKGIGIGEEKRLLNFIQNGLNKGRSLQLIAEFTDLSLRELKALIKKHKLVKQ